MTDTLREALELIAAPKRPDGTWNRDREACRQLAAAALAAPVQPAQPVAWLCELAEEDGSVKTMIVQQHPDGLRFNDMGEPSPFRVTPLYASPQALPLTAEQRAALVMVLCHYQDDDRVACLHELLAARPQAQPTGEQG